jgi:hypothetical protein
LFDGNIVHAFTTRFNLSIVQFIFEQESKKDVLDGRLTKLVGIFAETAEGVEVHVGRFKILCRVLEKYLDNDVKESDNDVESGKVFVGGHAIVGQHGPRPDKGLYEPILDSVNVAGVNTLGLLQVALVDAVKYFPLLFRPLKHVRHELSVGRDKQKHGRNSLNVAKRFGRDGFGASNGFEFV